MKTEQKTRSIHKYSRQVAAKHKKYDEAYKDDAGQGRDGATGEMI
jgi:hypothetical protein